MLIGEFSRKYLFLPSGGVFEKKVCKIQILPLVIYHMLLTTREPLRGFHEN